MRAYAVSGERTGRRARRHTNEKLGGLGGARRVRVREFLKIVPCFWPIGARTSPSQPPIPERLADLNRDKIPDPNRVGDSSISCFYIDNLGTFPVGRFPKSQ